MSAVQQALLMVGGVPTDPYFSNVVLLLHGDGVNGGTVFTDSSQYNVTMNVDGGITTSTAQSKFGSASILPVTNSNINTPANTRYGTGGDYTIEFWTYRPANVEFTRIFSVSSAGFGGFDGPQIFFFPADRFNLIVAGDTALQIDNFFGSTLLNIWVHIAVVRSGLVTTVYRNGISVGTANNSLSNANFSGTRQVIVGAFQSTGTNQQSWNGYIDEFRYTVGVARYTSNFTPPTEPYPNS